MENNQEPTVTETTEVTETPIEIDRHIDNPEYSNTEEFDINKETDIEAVVLPANTKSVLIKFSEDIDGLDIEEVKANFSKQELSNSGINIENISLTNPKDTFRSNLDDNVDTFVNEINYSDKKLTMSHPKIKSTGSLTGSAGLAKFSSNLALGEYTPVPLWHSGFWVTIRPPYDSDIVILETELAGSEIRLGRDTSTLVYSNYSVVFDRILSDFIVSHIVNNSLDLPNDTSLLDMISIQDYYPLLLGLISSMNPKGYTFIKNCINTTIIENNKPLCNFSVTGTVNPMNMLRVDKSALSKDMLTQMAKRGSKSVTLDEVKDYQLGISRMQEVTHSVPTANGSSIKITLKVPTLGEFIANGEDWISNVIDKSEKLFTEADNVERKNKKMNDTLNAVILGVYNVWITKIETAEGDYVLDRSDINNVLDMLSSDSKVMVSVIDHARNYIDVSALAIIATSAYKCPTCETNQPCSDNKPFKEFIPLNALEHFFDLTTLRLSKVTSRVV